MEIQPFGDRIVVKVLSLEEKSEGGLLLAPVSKDNSNQGEVVAVGNDVELINKGDVVIFNLGMGTSYSSENEEYKILQVRDVLGKVIK